MWKLDVKVYAEGEPILMRNLAKLLVGESKERMDQRKEWDIYDDFNATLDDFDESERKFGIS